jgi:hypothetical protein
MVSEILETPVRFLAAISPQTESRDRVQHNIYLSSIGHLCVFNDPVKACEFLEPMKYYLRTAGL